MSVATLPREAAGSRSTLWWGVVLLVVIEATALASFVSSYFYLKLLREEWPPAGIGDPDPLLAGVATALLGAATVPAWTAARSLRRGARRSARLWLVAALAGGAGYLALTAWDLAAKPYSWTSHAYGSLVWTLTGYEVAHVLALVAVTPVILLFPGRGAIEARHRESVEALAVYWTFAAVSGVVVFATLHLEPHFL